MSELFEYAAVGIELLAVAVLLAGLVLAALHYFASVFRGQPGAAFDDLRRHIGRSLLLTLELLIAADVIETVTIEPTFSSLGALGILVLIRTFLSFSLSVELHGHWPWQASSPQTTAGD